VALAKGQQRSVLKKKLIFIFARVNGGGRMPVILAYFVASIYAVAIIFAWLAIVRGLAVALRFIAE